MFVRQGLGCFQADIVDSFLLRLLRLFAAEGLSPPVPSDGTGPLDAEGGINASRSGGCPRSSLSAAWARAERLLARRLTALGLAEERLAKTTKGAWEKELLAWWLCQHTTARRRWVSERLGMGDESRVTQAIGRLKRKGQPELERLKRQLEQVYENRNGELEV